MNQTVICKGRRRRYNPRPEENAAWQRARARAGRVALGLVHQSTKSYNLDERLKSLDLLQQAYGEALGLSKSNVLNELVQVVERALLEDHETTFRELVARRAVVKRSAHARSITNWSEKSREHHLDLANELIDMAVLMLIDPTCCLSVSLIPGRRPANMGKLTYARLVKKQLKRLCDFIVRNGGTILGVVEPFRGDPACPHFHAFVVALDGSVQSMSRKIRQKWRDWHPRRKRAVVKRLTGVADVFRVVLYPHKAAKQGIPDELGHIGNRVISGGLDKLPHLPEEMYSVDPLIYLAEYLWMCGRRGIKTIDWRPLKFYACDDPFRTRDEALAYILCGRWNHVLYLGQTDATNLEAWRVIGVEYRKCDDGVVRATFQIYRGSGPIDWPGLNDQSDLAEHIVHETGCQSNDSSVYAEHQGVDVQQLGHHGHDPRPDGDMVDNAQRESATNHAEAFTIGSSAHYASHDLHFVDAPDNI